MKRRVLVLAEAVTLAHVVRPLVLAQSLPSNRFEVHFACAAGYDHLLEKIDFTRWSIRSIPSGHFLSALAKGSPLYDYPTLAGYVKEDLRVLKAVRPDLVVGDFRLSLAVSAPSINVPYVAVANAHWSPYAAGQFPLPEHPMVRLLGVSLATALFQMARPVLLPAIFTYHARSLNRLRREHGLPPLGDLRRVYTYGDYTLYPDVPGLIPTVNLPSNHRYIGPVLWSPDIALPPWWDDVPTGRPCVYVTLGSSGQIDVLPMVVQTLGELPISFLLATAGRADLEPLPNNVWASTYLPGAQAAQRSRLVICNGGSATVYQALAEGIPILGIASNMDQYLTMRYVEQAGAGILARAGQVTKLGLRRAIEKLLWDEKYKKSAANIANEFATYDAPDLFGNFVIDLFKE